MQKTLGLGAGIVLCLAGFYAGCSSSSSNDNNDAGTNTAVDSGTSGNVDSGNTGEGGTSDEAGTNEAGADAGDAGDGGSTIVLPTATLCPESDFIHPKLANTIVVDDVTLTKEANWTADHVYVLYRTLEIDDNGKLNVEAGTTICLIQDGQIRVGAGIYKGEAHFNGTADKPIIVTAMPSSSDATKPDSYHHGLQFDTFTSSTLSYVNIFYGGSGGGGTSYAFELTSTAHGTDATKPFKVDHLYVGNVQSNGIKIGTYHGIADGSDIKFGGFDKPFSTSPAPGHAFEVELQGSASVAKAVTYVSADIPDAAKHAYVYTAQSEGKIGNGDDGVRNVDVYDFGLPYLYKRVNILQVQSVQNDDSIGATLTFHEGVTWRHKGVIIVGATSGTAMGNLVVQGTAAKPVIFTSAEDTPAAGDWDGFYFVTDQMSATKTKIDQAQILYAGVDDSNPLTNQHVGRCGKNFVGAVMITGDSLTDYLGPQLSNLTIMHSASYGIVSGAKNDAPESHMTTDYSAAALNITISDVAHTALGPNGACTP